MTPKLTEEMREAIRKHPGTPLYVVDAETQTTYVLLPAETYQRVEALLYDNTEPNPDEHLPLAHEALQDAWDAPGMEQYDDYDSHRPKS